ncbi:hypothetical protein CAOG_01571 [Capsaspora owczarzaki ATCC 30864]|uniref:Glutaredoxin domain-containing protein n=1 Tax=Capsaspora owczarzaki (strain ATCC 30864) TaxID=595528 RepID=A0A0D2WJI9_CAPO3|nr:hypothetical protein CAOG_01571 [Capsaspora owczarzaki ATCC 30864]KJE90230.1 hypothetical protein CAOG_001571 [Capsaspora owczarzaki ATCC 30864]|eukprot:XP_004364439.2 hypothetical protein CAOG_01571 [Capsaspora owczarzaki ATCC 30864]
MQRLSGLIVARSAAAALLASAPRSAACAALAVRTRASIATGSMTLSTAAAAAARQATSPFAASTVSMCRGYATMAPAESESARDFIDKTVKGNPVVLFMKGVPEQPMCGFSRAVVQVLAAQNLKEYASVNVLASDEVRQGIKDYTNWPTIPQVFINGEFVGGCDILLNLHQSGELETMLKKTQ